MDKLKVSEYCCGCSLRTGTLVISWITLIVSCFSTAGITATLADLYKMRTSNTWDSSRERLVERETYIKACHLGWQLILVYLALLFCLAGIVLSLLAIIGVQKNTRKFVQWFYYYSILCYVFLLIFIPVSFTLEINEVAARIILTFTLLCGAVLYGYFVVVIRSYYLAIQANNLGIQNFVGNRNSPTAPPVSNENYYCTPKI